MRLFEQVGLDFADLLLPFFTIGLAAAIMATGWKFAQGVSVWAMMKIRGYAEREEVYLNGTRAIITKLGFMSTTFLILNGTENGIVTRWASVSNSVLDAQRIERISLHHGKLEQIGAVVKPAKNKAKKPAEISS